MPIHYEKQPEGEYLYVVDSELSTSLKFQSQDAINFLETDNF